MELRHLKLVRAVAESGNLTRAGETLFLTQSALSHQLKEIEAQLGAQLFQRINKRMVLTPVGKRVLRSAKVVLDELEQTEHDVKKYISGDAGKIRISTECYTCYHWLPALMKRFQLDFPNVEIVVVAEATRNPLPLLLDGRLDVVILSCPGQRLKGLAYHLLFSDEMVALVSGEHKFASRAYLKASDFVTETLILHRQPTEDSTLFRKILTPARVTPQKLMEIQLTEAIVEMVRAGLGIAVLAKWAIAPYLNSSALKAIPVKKSGLHRDWFAVTIKDEKAPPYLDAFVQQLTQYPKVQ